LTIEKTEVRPERWHDRVISFSTFDVQREDRIVFFSDGITQAGMGEYRTPLGWGLENVDKFMCAKDRLESVYLGPRVVAPSGRAREELTASARETTLPAAWFTSAVPASCW
jgi:serine phosphatase RsbU (regulator of sigma subunit)